MIQIAYPYFLYVGLPLVAIAAYWYWFYYKHPVYLFSALAPLKSLIKGSSKRKIVPFLLRVATLTALCVSLSRLRAPDERSKIPVEGVDIMLVMDISGSMNIFDDLQDRRPRIDVARAEALKFIDRRENDPIGLVIFSGVAISRCPLTLDKQVLKVLLEETDTSTIEAQGTVLSRAILTAANRLKKSDSKEQNYDCAYRW